MLRLLSSHPLSVLPAEAFTGDTILVAIKLRVPRPVRPDGFLAGVEGLAGLGVGTRGNEHSCGQKDREAHQLGSRLIHCLVTAPVASKDESRHMAEEQVRRVTEVEELLLDWLYSFLTAEEQDKLMAWHLGVSL